MSIPTDPMFGRPIGGLPQITTWGARRDAPRRARSFVALADLPKHCEGAALLMMRADDTPLTLWDPSRSMTIDGGRRTLVLVRSLRKAEDVRRDPLVVAAWPLPWEPLPVTADEIAAIRAPGTRDDELIDVVRARRGEPVGGEAQWLERSPWTMSLAECSAAASRGLTTAHLYRGVREEHGRWQGYIGLGGMLRIVCTCDTREEALAVATGFLWREWINEIEAIREARGGDLSWGWPVPAPSLEDEDPQTSYREPPARGPDG